MRSPADYAIEHAGYLADAVKSFLRSVETAEVLNPDAEDGLRETVGDQLQALRSGVYEFEKRARVAIQREVK